MNQQLREFLVCPRDHKTLQDTEDALLCPDGHTYPIVDGIPVMLLDEVMPTQWNTTSTLERVAAYRAGQPSDLADLLSPSSDDAGDQVDPHVQKIISATCGYLYAPLIGTLQSYPIPRLRLPQGDGGLFLDIGCNWGRWSVAAARAGYRPVGVDPAIEAVIAARRVARQLGVESSFVVADGRYLPFAPGLFDVAFSYSVLQHFSKENARLVLAEIARVLKSQATSFVQMPNIYGARCLYHQARRRFRPPTGFEVRYWTPTELVETFTQLIGETLVEVDGFFGLGIQPSDLALLPFKYQVVVRSSELLRRASRDLRWMANAADSLYLKSTNR